MSSQTLATMLHQTSDEWRDWVRGLAIPLEWQKVVIRAAITLKLCQHEETGAIVAALTTSIPEAPGSGRNWDYRYCWIRDAYYTVQALNRLGALDVLENYLSYLRNIVDQAEGGDIQPLYAVSGEPKLDEGDAEGLAGYRGMGPVRVGNAAYTQVQHDAYGQIVLSNAQAFFDERLFRTATAEDFASLETGRRARLRDPRPARRRPVGVPHPHLGPHLFLGDVLGGLRPAGQHRRRRSGWTTAPSSGASAADAVRKAIEKQAWFADERALRRDLRRRRARRQPAPAGRHALPRAGRPALPRHLRGGREGAAARRAHAALCQPRTISACPRRRSTSAPSG